MNKGQVKNKQFINYLLKIKSLESYFDLLFVKWVPRNQNKEANHHAKNALYKITKTRAKKR